MRLRSVVLVPFFAASALAMHCGGTTALQTTSPEGGSPGEGGVSVVDDAGVKNPDAIGATTSSKVDLLLVVDNSASMGDKSKLLGSSLSPLLKKVAEAGDVHFGVINTSLGSMGGDVCASTGSQNSLAHLSTVGPGSAPLASAAQGFLSYGGGGSANIDTFIADATTLVNGVGESGCGLEAQLESAYRFLVQPDPWVKITIDQFNQADNGGARDRKSVV